MEPLTRKEFFLNAIAEGTPTPPPLTREERYLAKIAENTSGDSLPPIEAGDDGKVLTASDGEAVWASGGGGGGGNAVYINFDTANGRIDASYNDLLQYYYDGKFIFSKDSYEDEGTTNYVWHILTQLKDESTTFYAHFTAFYFYDGSPNPSNMIFYANDPDEKMLIED